MARIPMTAEQKAAKIAAARLLGVERRAAARQAKNVQRQKEWAIRVEATQKLSLEPLTEVQRQEVLKLVASFTNGTPFDELVKSILSQYVKYGKLSDKQLHILLRVTPSYKLDQAKTLEAEQEFFDEFQLHEAYDLKLKLVDVRDVQNPSNFQYAPAVVRVYRFKNTVNQVFKLTSNNKKYDAAFSEVGVWHNIHAKIKFVAPDTKHIVLNPVGVKFK